MVIDWGVIGWWVLVAVMAVALALYVDQGPRSRH